MKIAFVTYAGAPNLTSDDQIVAREIESRGVTILPVIWDDPQVDWAVYDLIVLRACWDYHVKTEQFENWLNSLKKYGKKVLNTPALNLWNLRKTYLKDLADQGVKIPKTVFTSAGETSLLVQLLQENRFDQVVVKPTVSLDGLDTWRTSLSEAHSHEGRWRNLIERRPMMIQEFLPEILSEGELSFLFFGGDLSHVIRKRPGNGDFRIQAQYGGSREQVFPSESLIKQAEYIAGKVDAFSLRVDCVEVQGKLSLIELEIIDPMLYFAYAPGSEKNSRIVC